VTEEHGSLGVDVLRYSQVIGRSTGRAVALTLLLLAGLDLAFPSICQAESALPSATHTDDASVGEQQPEPAAPERSSEEDCFCCCVHIRPQPITRGIEALANVRGLQPAKPSLEPELRAQALFHPPRQ
jgi:hypothetical protein